jgi:hypothetical protein
LGVLASVSETFHFTEAQPAGDVMKYLALTLALLGTLSFSGLMIGCQEQGPAERTGERIDDAVDDAGDAIDDALDY